MWLNIWQKFVGRVGPILKGFWRKIASIGTSGQVTRSMTSSEMKGEVSNAAKEKATNLKYTPQTIEDFISVVQRTPKSILGVRDRKRIAAVMSFDERMVGELMVPKSKMIFVSGDEMLGPLMLDKLYKSGFMDFPVVDAKEKVKGIINTEALNALKIRKMEKAEKNIDRNVLYLHEKDLLSFAVEEIKRTNGHYYLVKNEKEELVGFFTLQMLLDYLLG